MSDSNPSTPERFPDLYALLGLKPLEREPAAIEQALRRLAARIQAGSNPTDAAQRQRRERDRKLFEFSKQHLLDPLRKQRYDQQWQALYGQAVAQSAGKAASVPSDKSVLQRPSPAISRRSAQATIQKPSWDLRELRALLPNGDPHAPFRPAEYAASGANDLRSRFSADFVKLQSLLATTGVAALSVDTEEDKEVGVEESTSATPSSSLSATGRRPSTSIAGRLRKKRERGFLWGAIGALSAVGVVLGVAYWLMHAPPDSTLTTTRIDEPKVGGDLLNSQLATADVAAGGVRPRRSGLPSVPGIDSSTVVPGMPAPRDTTSSDSAMNTGNEQIADGKMSDMLVPRTPPADLPPATMPRDMTSRDAMQEVPASTPTAEMTMEITPADNETVPDTVALSASEREQWSSAMLAARKSIGLQQYVQATQQLEEARSLAKTSQQTEQLARLTRVRELAQEFSEALQRAVSGMGAGETFIVGKSTDASFVDASPERLTLRIEGKNQSWTMTELPIGIAFAIVDMAMDREHPRSLAAKAAFTLVHPASQGKELALNRAQQMMAEAIDAGVVTQDMAQVFSDDYKLP